MSSKRFIFVAFQRNFTEDSFIGECDIPIPNEVMQGETRQSWYPLLGRPASANENQGDILIIMSFVVRRSAGEKHRGGGGEGEIDLSFRVACDANKSFGRSSFF